MKHIFALILVLSTGCQYLSPQFERAIEQEVIQDVQKVADANIPATEASAQKQ